MKGMNMSNQVQSLLPTALFCYAPKLRRRTSTEIVSGTL